MARRPLSGAAASASDDDRRTPSDAWVAGYAVDGLLVGSSNCARQITPTFLDEGNGYALELREVKGSEPAEEDDAASRKLARRPSHENLWIDFSSEPEEFVSKLFFRSFMREEVRNLQRWRRRHEKSELPPIRETVGFAMPNIGRGSMLGSVFTLVASAMGAGCLSLPHMFMRSGLGFGLVVLGCGALLAHLSLVVLMSCARYTESASFAELVALSHQAACASDSNDGSSKDDVVLEGRSSSLVVDAVIAFYGIAAVLVYMMLIGDFLGGIACSPAIGWASASRGPLIVGSLLIVFPLSLPRHISALRHVCILSTGSIVFLMLVVFARTPSFVQERQAAAGDGSPAIVWFSGDWSANLQSFSIAVFAFAAHTNAVPTVAVLKRPRALRIWQVSLFSVTIELAVYTLIAVSGYLCFLGETKQDFVRNYPNDDPLMLVVRCVYSVPVVFGVPINLSPAAASLQSLARRAAARFDDHDSGSVGSGERRGAWLRTWIQRLRHGCDERLLHGIIVAVVLTSCAVVAIWSEDVADVIGLLGSFFGTLICLWWPLRIYWSVLSKLHARSLASFLGATLAGGSALGALAFLVQVWDAYVRWRQSA